MTRVNNAKGLLVEDEIRNLVSVVRNLEDEVEMDNLHLDKIIKLVGEVIDGDVSWKGAIGSVLQDSGYLLWSIPGINILWGTAAYAAGTFLKWIGHEDVENHLHESFIHARMNLVDNMKYQMSNENIKNDISRLNTDELKFEMVSDWMHEKESEMRVSEANLVATRDAYHGIMFWKDLDNELFFGVSVGVGNPSTGIWMFGIVFKNDLSSSGRVNFSSFQGDHYKSVRDWMSLTSQVSFVTSRGLRLASYSPFCLTDSLTVEKVKNLPVFCKNLSGSLHDKRLAVFDFLCGRECSLGTLIK